MATRSDLEAELLSQLQAASNSTLFSASRLTKLIKDAYIWATQQHIWRDLVKAKSTDSEANQEYYDYPIDFRSDTIVMLELDGGPYERKNFEDYRDYKRNNPNGTDKIFANYGRQYFIYPTPTADGNRNIVIWGAVQADALNDGTDKTIFSDNKESGNEAVTSKALSVAIKRTDANLSASEKLAAMDTLAKLNREEWVSTQRDKRKQHPKFNVPNYFGSSVRAPVGNFK